MIIRTIARKEPSWRVAAYARVSTLAESQEESYDTQMKYYSDYIGSNSGWNMVKIYSDKGITGTSAEKRPGFQEMIRDAQDGKIDIILCKSLSRFSRNYEEAQKYTHMLKGIGVEIRFEKEGLSTLDPQMDMALGVMMAVAQQESKSISENIRWTYRRLGEQGIRHVGSNHLLGYDEINGVMTPNADRWVVELVFQRYAEGRRVSDIMQELKDKGAKTLQKQNEYDYKNVLNILKNEVYVGDRLMQKTPARNYLTKKPDPTIQREPKYYRDHHTPIITRDLWNTVQERLERERKAKEAGVLPRKDSHPYYGRIICGCCGKPYRRRTHKCRNGDQFPVWKCSGRIKGDCKGRIVREPEVEQLLTATNRIIVRDSDFDLVAEDVAI